MADETRVQVLNEPERNPETDSWMWLFRSGEDDRRSCSTITQRQGQKSPCVIFSYRGSADIWRRMDTRVIIIWPDINVLLGTCETLLHRCHTERKEYDYSLRQCRSTCSVPSCLIVSGTQKQNHTAEQRKQFRRKEKPILEAFWNWLDQQRPNKGTRLAKAVNYAQKSKDTLMTYLEDVRRFIQ